MKDRQQYHIAGWAFLLGMSTAQILSGNSIILEILQIAIAALMLIDGLRTSYLKGR